MYGVRWCVCVCVCVCVCECVVLESVVCVCCMLYAVYCMLYAVCCMLYYYCVLTYRAPRWSISPLSPLPPLLLPQVFPRPFHHQRVAYLRQEQHALLPRRVQRQVQRQHRSARGRLVCARPAHRPAAEASGRGRLLFRGERKRSRRGEERNRCDMCSIVCVVCSVSRGNTLLTYST